MGGGDVTSIPRFSNIRSAMRRARQEFVPNIPHSVDDVVIEDTWGVTWSGDDYLLQKKFGIIRIDLGKKFRIPN
jgi:hypothetical protein